MPALPQRYLQKGAKNFYTHAWKFLRLCHASSAGTSQLPLASMLPERPEGGGALLAAPIGRFFGGFSFFFLLEHSFFFFLFCVCLWLCIAVPSKHNALLFLSAFECPHGTVLSNVQNTCRMRCKYTEHACTISNARTFTHSLHARAAQALTHLVLPMCCC